MSVNWSDITLNVIMPLVGIFLVVTFVVSFFLPFGQRLEGARQLIKGFGLDLQVSVRTLLILSGLAMFFASVLLQVQNRQFAALREENRDLKARLEMLRDQLDHAGRHIIRANLILPKQVNVGTLDLREIECRYMLSTKPDVWVQASLVEGPGGNSLRIILNDIGREDVIQQLEVRRKGTNQVLGASQNIYPLQPLIYLQSPE